jgi:F0F1-type ATP synthase membrane subunit b/b'
MEERLAFREGELETAMSMLDDERVAKEEAQAEVARIKAEAQQEVERIRAKAREEVNRIHDKALEEIARKKGEYEAKNEKNKAEAQKVVDLAKGQVKTERARALAATFTLKEAQRDSRNHLRLKAAFKIVSRMANSRTAP